MHWAVLFLSGAVLLAGGMATFLAVRNARRRRAARTAVPRLTEGSTAVVPLTGPLPPNPDVPTVRLIVEDPERPPPPPQ